MGLLEMGIFQSMLPPSHVKSDVPDIPIAVDGDILLARLSFQSYLLHQGCYALWTQSQKEELAKLVEAVLAVKDEADSSLRPFWHNMGSLALALCQRIWSRGRSKPASEPLVRYSRRLSGLD